jgi:hypothetical protein
MDKFQSRFLDVRLKKSMPFFKTKIGFCRKARWDLRFWWRDKKENSFCCCKILKRLSKDKLNRYKRQQNKAFALYRIKIPLTLEFAYIIVVFKISICLKKQKMRRLKMLKNVSFFHYYSFNGHCPLNGHKPTLKVEIYLCKTQLDMNSFPW